MRRRQQRERFVGIALAILGVAVLVVAIVALNQHRTGGSSPKAAASASSGSAKTSAPAKTGTSGSPGPSASSASHPPSTISSSPGATSSLSPTALMSDVSLVVLNNSTISGLAGAAKSDFENRGWTVTSAGNYQNDILSTCAYYDPSDPQAKAAATLLQQQFPAIARVKEQFSGLESFNSPIVVILTSGYQNG